MEVCPVCPWISRFPDWQSNMACWKMDDVTMFLLSEKVLGEPWGSRFSNFDFPIDA